jgi:type I restriction enzyme, S subunit
MNERPLADLIKLQSGYAFKSKEYTDNGHFLVRIGNVQDGYLSLDNPRYVALDGKTEKFALDEGDFLTSLTGNIGRVARIEKTHLPAALNQRVARLKVRDASALSADYLFYFLSSDLFREELCEGGHGAAQQNVSPSAINGLTIPLPPIPEQRRIVGILDEAFAGITTAKANAEKNLQNARELFQSALTRAVVGEATKRLRDGLSSEGKIAGCDLEGLLRRISDTKRKTTRSEATAGHEAVLNILPNEWEHASIQSLFTLIDYRGKNPPRSQDGRRLITAKNIKMGYLADDPITFVSEETYIKWMVRGFPKLGDILFVTEGHTMGFVALNTRTDDFALAQRTITLQPAVSFDSKFFFYFMMSVHFQDLVKLNATGAAAVGMKGSKFRTLPLPFPPFAEQKAIVSKLDDLLDETQRLESIYQRKLAALDELKKSLLHQAFSGQL